MQTAWFRIWTLVVVSISNDDNHYTTSASIALLYKLFSYAHVFI